MKIETHHIPPRGTTLRFQETAERFSILAGMGRAGECRFVTPLTIELDVVPVREVIEVSGSLTFTIEMTCCRCVAGYEQVMNHSFKLIFSQTIPEALKGSDEEDAELTAEQIGVVFFKDDAIDFREAVQEQVVLALPYKPLCHENCKGLCAQCGVDLNRGDCLCESQAPSGPFDVLKSLNLPGQPKKEDGDEN